MLDRDEHLGEFPLGTFSEDDALATFAITEAADVVAFNGGVFATGTLNVTEARDVAAMLGGIFATGVLSCSEAADSASMMGVVAWSAVLASTESGDVAALSGSVAWLASLAVTDAPDSVAFTGLSEWSAILAATEAADTISFDIVAEWQAILNATEAGDVIAFIAEIIASGSLNASEDSDLVSFTGAGVQYTGELNVTESDDVASFDGLVLVPAGAIDGELHASEATDSVGINVFVEPLGRREQILARIFERLQAIPDVETCVRDRAELVNVRAPVILLADNFEDISVRSHIVIRPDIFIGLDDRLPRNENVGPDLNNIRRDVVKGLLFDPEIKNLLGPNGIIRYHGCTTDLRREKKMTGEMGISMSFIYPVSPNEVRR